MSGDAGEGAFSVRAAAVVIAAGVFAFAAFFVLSAFAPDLRRGNDGGAHALSRSAVGFAGLVRLLEAQGTPVRVGRTEQARDGAGLVVLTPTLETNPRTITRALGGSGPPILVVLPKWRVQPQPGRPGWVRRLAPAPEVEVAAWAEAWWIWSSEFRMTARTKAEAAVVLTTGRSGTAATPAGRVDKLQTLPPSLEGLEPMLLTSEGTVLGRVRASERDVFILSDPDLLNTQGLAELETARAAMAILEDARISTDPIVFDVTLNGLEGGRSLLKLAFTPPFLAATLCAAAAAGLAAWQAAARFGPRAHAGRAVALGAEALADNAAALIRLSGREHRVADRYAQLIEAAAARAVAAPVGEGAAGYLDSLQRRRPGLARWSTLRAEAAAVRTRAQLLEAAQRMHRWKQEAAGGG